LQDQNTTLKEILKTARKKARLSQLEMGKLIGVSQARYSVLEKNPEKFRVENLVKVCKHLKIKLKIIIKPLS